MKLPTRTEVIANARAAGKQICAVLPYHYPRPLLRALDVEPVEVWGPPGVDTSTGNRHFQAYACGIVRNAAAFILDRQEEDIDFLLVPHTCDALQGMGSVLKDFIKPRQPILTFYHPRGRRPADRGFYRDEIRRLGQDLEAKTGRSLDSQRLNEEIDKEVEANHALAGLLHNRRKVALSDRAFWTLVRSAEYLPPEAFVAAAEAAPAGEDPEGVPIMLSGIVPEPMELFDRINEAGAYVAADDFACGSRRIYPYNGGKDPFDRLADAFMGAPADPTLGYPIADRLTELKASINDSGAKGFVVYDVKFCEPELFDLPILRKGLKEAGIPSLHIEHDLDGSLSNQVLTRMEAFVEMIQ